MADSDGIRVGDPERERAVELLGEAMATGYLTVEEFDQRTHAAYRATHRGDLRGLLADLPVADRLFPPASAEVAAHAPAEVLAIDWGTVVRKGVWTVPARLRIEGSMGTAKIDFRRADFPYGGVEIEVQVSASTVRVQLGDGVQLDRSGLETTGWSSVKDRVSGVGRTGTPVVVLRGSLAGMSSLVVRR